MYIHASELETEIPNLFNTWKLMLGVNKKLYIFCYQTLKRYFYVLKKMSFWYMQMYYLIDSYIFTPPPPHPLKLNAWNGYS